MEQLFAGAIIAIISGSLAIVASFFAWKYAERTRIAIQKSEVDRSRNVAIFGLLHVWEFLHRIAHMDAVTEQMFLAVQKVAAKMDPGIRLESLKIEMKTFWQEFITRQISNEYASWRYDVAIDKLHEGIDTLMQRDPILALSIERKVAALNLFANLQDDIPEQIGQWVEMDPTGIQPDSEMVYQVSTAISAFALKQLASDLHEAATEIASEINGDAVAQVESHVANRKEVLDEESKKKFEEFMDEVIAIAKSPTTDKRPDFQSQSSP